MANVSVSSQPQQPERNPIGRCTYCGKSVSSSDEAYAIKDWRGNPDRSLMGVDAYMHQECWERAVS